MAFSNLYQVNCNLNSPVILKIDWSRVDGKGDQ